MRQRAASGKLVRFDALMRAATHAALGPRSLNTGLFFSLSRDDDDDDDD